MKTKMPKKNKDGKLYIPVTDSEIKKLPRGTSIYIISKKEKGIAPKCKHNFIITDGIPRNIKYCTKCVYWEFTREPATPKPVDRRKG